MNSALYHGQIRHRRWHPRLHAFCYQLTLLYLDLDELDSLFRQHWWWSARRPAPIWLRRADHFGDPSRPLAECVRDRIEQTTQRRPTGPIRLLTQPRCFGYGFNPISIYYGFDAADREVETLLAEVTNTPWGERHCYCLHHGRLPGGRHRYRFSKTLHVSPFMPMDLEYVWRSNEPGERLNVHLAVEHQRARQFDATLALRRQPLTAAAMARTLLRLPPQTVKIIAAIYWQALRLWLKRTPVYAHVSPQTTAS